MSGVVIAVSLCSRINVQDILTSLCQPYDVMTFKIGFVFHVLKRRRLCAEIAYAFREPFGVFRNRRTPDVDGGLRCSRGRPVLGLVGLRFNLAVKPKPSERIFGLMRLLALCHNCCS